MKCVLDTTVNLKQLVTPGSEKLMLPVNGEPLVRHHFRAMSEAGVTSVFILIEIESPARSAIASEAMKFGFSPTFLEIESDVIANRKGIMAAEPYMKDPFIYWPVNRIISDSLARDIVKHPVNSHQIAALLYTGKSHPQISKNSIFKVEFKADEKTAKRTGKETTQGHDIGVYKCGAIIFKLIEKVSKDRPLSWNRIHAALSRAGRSLVMTTTSDHWSLIESKHDVDTMERLQAGQTVGRIEINEIDKKLLGGLYKALLPPMLKLNILHKQGAALWVLIMILAASTLLLGKWLFAVMAGIISASVVITYPLIEYMSDEEPVTQKLREVTLPILRIAIIVILSLSCFQTYGLDLWALMSILLIGAEIFFIIKPIEIPDEKVQLMVSSYAIHGIWLFVSTLFVYPTLMLMTFGLLSISISITKGQIFYREMERE
ncbi:hypothetical protein [Pleionea sediminis]|uniref:hypothetical protein n=1 Tax=Pleionea sediminis TaxID=2569479 RepID=UPI0011850BF6|nr:hypothetical protein [Pleionea sediminis]